MTTTDVTTTDVANTEESMNQEIGKATERFHDFLTKAGLQKKQYQTDGIRFCLRNELAGD